MTESDDETTDQDLKALQNRAVDTMKLAAGKIEFLASQGVLNPFALMQDRVETLVEWMLPSGEIEVRDGLGIPTNVERLKFDIFCNQRTIDKCDQAMGQRPSGLHVVNGRGDARSTD